MRFVAEDLRISWKNINPMEVSDWLGWLLQEQYCQLLQCKIRHSSLPEPRKVLRDQIAFRKRKVVIARLHPEACSIRPDRTLIGGRREPLSSLPTHVYLLHRYLCYSQCCSPFHLDHGPTLGRTFPLVKYLQNLIEVRDGRILLDHPLNGNWSWQHSPKMISEALAYPGWLESIMLTDWWLQWTTQSLVSCSKE
jgi:hypothetical protein